MIKRISAAVAMAAVLAIGGSGVAMAKHGADDPPGHHKGKHHNGGKHKHHNGGKHHGNGNDDGPNHT